MCGGVIHCKEFDMINHEILINKLVAMDSPAHLVQLMAAFLLDHDHTVVPYHNHTSLVSVYL